MRQYYIHDGSLEKGPFTLEQLKNETITSNTQVWYEGLAAWTTADQIEELRSLLAVKPPPLQVKVQPVSAVEHYEKNKKSSKAKYIWTALGIVAVVVIGTLIYSNNQSQQALNNLQNSVSQKESQEAIEKLRQAETRNRWAQFVKLERGDYQSGVFGGISGLDLTILNTTEYVIDEIEVEVDYIKENGGVHKTEIVVFKNLPSNTKQTKYAPESSRGTSVDVRIKSVTAPAFNFCYNVHRTGVGGDDPWKCQ